MRRPPTGAGQTAETRTLRKTHTRLAKKWTGALLEASAWDGKFEYKLDLLGCSISTGMNIRRWSMDKLTK
jgi:hypothetical protein